MENNAEIVGRLRSGEPEVVEAAVREVREKGDLEVAAALLGCLGELGEGRLATTVCNLLADVRDSRFRALLMERLEASRDEGERCALMRVVWESALDYSAYLEVFLRLLEEGEFAVAFEASTVIENMVHHLSAEQRERLHGVIHGFPEEKRFLVENIHGEMECGEE
jgi:hypothetical protein